MLKYYLIKCFAFPSFILISFNLGVKFVAIYGAFLGVNFGLEYLICVNKLTFCIYVSEATRSIMLISLFTPVFHCSNALNLAYIAEYISGKYATQCIYPPFVGLVNV